MAGLTRHVSFFCLAHALAALPAFAADEKPEPTPPYYASMKFPETNMRVGPGKEFPINWVYHRKGLPVQVIDLHQDWRNIVDSEGDKGWVSKNQLSMQRTAVTTPALSTLHSNPSDDSAVAAQVETGVIGKIVTCQANWCQLDLGTHRGWLDKSVLWGVGADEVIAGK